ncbi:MAG: alpha/beta hydrolase-fold protein [Planctomycetota bacterium]
MPFYRIVALVALCSLYLPVNAQEEASNASPGSIKTTTVSGLPGVESFRMQSQLLTEFWGRPMHFDAGIVLPPDSDSARVGSDGKGPPVCYSIHGFGGSHRTAWRLGPGLREQMASDDYPRMIYVFLNAQFPLGHHEFADSVNNGPWGQALIEELIPCIEKHYGASSQPAGRFLTGHSSGGWSSLWLQVTYPEFFAATWSTAPDSVDFRDFTGIDIYNYDNAYFDPSGNEIPLSRKRQSDEWNMTIKAYSQREAASRPYGGQMASFDAVFSPRNEDGRPMPLFDRKTGRIDRFVAEAWKKYDIGLIIKNQWEELEPKLKGKIHVYIGELDTYRLEGAVKLLKTDMESLGSDAEFVLVEGADHSSVKQPHSKWWPKGMLNHIHHEMWEHWKQNGVSDDSTK